MLRKVSMGLIVALAACGAARVVHRTHGGGVIELQGDHGTAMERATTEMAAHCGANNYTVVQESDEPVGTDTTERTTYSGSTTSAQQSTRTVYARRVHYQCNGMAGAPGAMPAAAPSSGPPPPPPPPPSDGYY